VVQVALFHQEGQEDPTNQHHANVYNSQYVSKVR
jgi:hypothetical protein